MQVPEPPGSVWRLPGRVLMLPQMVPGGSDRVRGGPGAARSGSEATEAGLEGSGAGLRSSGVQWHIPWNLRGISSECPSNLHRNRKWVGGGGGLPFCREQFDASTSASFSHQNGDHSCQNLAGDSKRVQNGVPKMCQRASKPFQTASEHLHEVQGPIGRSIRPPKTKLKQQN